jgi:excisionase family DNA binding protein
MGQQIAQSFGAGQSTSPVTIPGAPGSGPAIAPDLLSPADAARVLGVSENDVLTSLADGSLKGKKIGATWRITREALDQFLKS